MSVSMSVSMYVFTSVSMSDRPRLASLAQAASPRGYRTLGPPRIGFGVPEMAGALLVKTARI
eukprot:12743491-Alexandrium_andersonii.AAC.1